MTALIRLASLSEVAKARPSQPTLKGLEAEVRAWAEERLTVERRRAGKRELTTDPRIWSEMAKPIVSRLNEERHASAAALEGLRALIAESAHEGSRIPRLAVKFAREMAPILEAHGRWLNATMRTRRGPKGWKPLTALVAEVGAPLLPGPDGVLRIGEDLTVADLVAISVLAGLLTRADLTSVDTAKGAIALQRKRVIEALRRLAPPGTQLVPTRTK